MKSVANKKHQSVLLKRTFEKILQDRRDDFYDVFAEALEDIALSKAIEEGMKTKKVQYKDVSRVLNRNAG